MSASLRRWSCALLVAVAPLACTRAGNDEQPGSARPVPAPSAQQPVGRGGGPNWGAGSEHMGIGQDSVRVGGTGALPAANDDGTAGATVGHHAEPPHADDPGLGGVTAREAPIPGAPRAAPAGMDAGVVPR